MSDQIKGLGQVDKTYDGKLIKIYIFFYIPIQFKFFFTKFSNHTMYIY